MNELIRMEERYCPINILVNRKIASFSDSCAFMIDYYKYTHRANLNKQIKCKISSKNIHISSLTIGFYRFPPSLINIAHRPIIALDNQLSFKVRPMIFIDQLLKTRPSRFILMNSLSQNLILYHLAILLVKLSF